MPDLSHEASAKYWSEFVDPMIYRVITFMESVEDWTMDGNPELEQALSDLGKVLDSIHEMSQNDLGNEDHFIRIVGNIKTSRGLRLLQAIDTAIPGSASEVLRHAELTTMSSSDPAGYFLKRNLIFERLRLLARVFSEHRLNLVLKALEGEE